MSDLWANKIVAINPLEIDNEIIQKAYHNIEYFNKFTNQYIL